MITTAHRYCTYFDAHYLSRGLALYRSLARHDRGFTLTVLCLDDATLATLERLRLPGLELLPLAALEAAHPELLAAKSDRTRIEYYFTLTPTLVLHELERAGAGEVVTYLDADLYFFADPAPIFHELDGHSTLMIAHRFPPRLASLEDHGVYNVGLLSFRHDADGLACLSWWRDRCLEWCSDRVEPGRFADQKYLDEWPTRFRGVRVLEYAGAGVAPWNIDVHPIEHRDGTVWIGSAPLVMFHFHGLKRLRAWIYDSGLAAYGAHLSPVLRTRIYSPYLRELEDVDLWLDRAAPDPGRRWGSIRSQRRPLVALAKGFVRGSLLIGAGGARR